MAPGQTALSPVASGTMSGMSHLVSISGKPLWIVPLVILGVGSLGPGCSKRPTEAELREQERASLRADRKRALARKKRMRTGAQTATKVRIPLPAPRPVSPPTPVRKTDASVSVGIAQVYSGKIRSWTDMIPKAPRLAKSDTDPAAVRCRRDTDCVLTSRRDGYCCAVGCPGARNALRADFDQHLRAHLKQHCAGKSCPMVDCAIEFGNQVWKARCRKSRCQSVRESAGTPGGGRLPRPLARDIRKMMGSVIGKARWCLARSRVSTLVLLRVRLSGRTGRADRLEVRRSRTVAWEKPNKSALAACLLSAIKRARVPPSDIPT